MARQIEIYFDLSLENLAVDLYLAPSSTVAANDLVCTARPGKPGYFLADVSAVAAGLYDVVSVDGYGIDQVRIGSTDNQIYQCSGHAGGGTSSESSNAGQYSVTIRTIVPGTPDVAVANAYVTIRQGSTLVRAGYTNSSGNFVVALDSGSYTMNITAPGFQDIVSRTLTIDGATVSSVSMTQLSVTQPAGPGIMALTIDILRGGQLVANSNVVAELRDKTSVLPTGIALLAVASGTTNSQGRVVLQLPYSSAFTSGDGIYRIRARDPITGQIDHDACYTVPDLSVGIISQLIPA